MQPAGARRSARIALVVGTLLVLINDIDKLVALEIGAADVLKIALTYVIPYCVSTYASVMTAVPDRGASIAS